MLYSSTGALLHLRQLYTGALLQLSSSPAALQLFSLPVLPPASASQLFYDSSTALQLYSSTALQLYQLYSSTGLQVYGSTVYSSTAPLLQYHHENPVFLSSRGEPYAVGLLMHSSTAVQVYSYSSTASTGLSWLYSLQFYSSSTTTTVPS